MSNQIRKHGRVLGLSSLALVSLLIVAPLAYAQDSTPMEHEKQMMKGKDHADAQRATNKPGPAARMSEHAQQMMKGKDHAAAQLSTAKGEPADKVRAGAKQHENQMKMGKDHAAAQVQSAALDATDSKAKK